MCGVGASGLETVILYNLSYLSGIVCESVFCGNLCGYDHAAGHGASVGYGESAQLLDGVTECVAVVKESAHSAVELIGLNDIALDLYAAGYHLGEVECAWFCYGVKELAVQDDSVFDYLGKAVTQHRRIECGEGVGVKVYQGGLMECAHQVLAGANVHGCLAAYR